MILEPLPSCLFQPETSFWNYIQRGCFVGRHSRQNPELEGSESALHQIRTVPAPLFPSRDEYYRGLDYVLAGSKEDCHFAYGG
jgi:hypothetical protein